MLAAGLKETANFSPVSTNILENDELAGEEPHAAPHLF